MGPHVRNDIIGIKNNYVSQITKNYLKPEDGIIIEGGSGKGQNVAALVNNGYKCIGIDWAEQTVCLLNQYCPELDIRHGDVRKLPFDNGHFIGYWSLGVIEHFWEGYNDILKEMNRVINNDGFLFLTFPYMSLIRKLKAFLGFYPCFFKENENENFYQFVLNHEKVISDLKIMGFVLVEVSSFDGIKGFKDEVNIFRSFLQNIYDGKSCQSVRIMIDRFLKAFASHCALLIFQKK